MERGKLFVVVLIITGVFAYTNVIMAAPNFGFGSMQDTWWMITKNMDKGYVFLGPTEFESVKAKKFKEKSKKGFMYIPDDAWTGSEYENVWGIFLNNEGGWDIVDGIRLSLHGGTPTDFVCVTEDHGPGYGMTMVLQFQLTEDKKSFGVNIKRSWTLQKKRKKLRFRQ